MSTVSGEGETASQAVAPGRGSGQVAPRYRPLLLLGHGGMGSVEAVAEELEDGTTRVVALKRILRTATMDASRLEMFLRETRLTALLDHPNVIKSLASGEANGEVFLAMEYVAGEPLSALIAAARERGETLPVPLIAYILAEACEGLHAAHEVRGPDGELLGVVHRDVSPHNVMVGYDGTVKLLDFGVAKIDLVDCAARTKTGEVKGKTAYMSPEQAMGDTVDRRSDLYSVGAVLFESLTGKRMWGGGTDFDVLRRLALEDAPRLADILPTAPAGLASLQAALIERDPGRRPATAHDVAVALREYASPTGTAVLARTVMTRFFEAERLERERLIADALASGEPAPTGLSRGVSGRAGAGESAPVFVTHQGLALPASSRRSGLVAAVAAVAAILGGTFGLAYRGGPAVSDPRATATEATRGTTAATTAADIATARLASSREVATTLEGHGASGTSAIAASRAPAAVVRRLATPRPGPSAHASGSPATPPPPTTKPPEPPDVDPTPF